ncbi:putative glucan endo-1,3-beta-glucosidase eglC [Cytospora mali]|uniref:glucan endo-1,3-beta-D-glucosidase n=1 Tax=Cytospora mali TaxID=578113 RepID=A0A194WB86_CYTMA|nr:putative glucan endo-1,3-beta-glucosidase eglC [Valsa mali]
MVCSKKATQTAAAVLTAASTIYGGQSGAAATPQADIVSKAATVSAANSGIKGFNYGAFFLDQTAKKQVDFQYEFNRAQNLANTTGWNSARLYTMVQSGTASDPISAIPAAIATKTTLLLGMWVSGSTAAIDNEIAALKSAITTYGTAFTDLVKGISVGSEDLYRAAQGDASSPGVEVDALISYISKVRNAIKGTALESIPVGHVDTYDSFENATNTKIISDLDWIGFDGYPYWEKANGNSIDDASELFYRGLNKTKAIAGDKPVYVTETGWPVSGDQYGQAVASDANARKYWKDIACTLTENNINVWWYILQESQNGQASPDFGLFGAGDLGTVPQSYDLSC